MSLLETNVSKNISRDKTLWRYMGLDKLIHLLNTKKLFFTSVNSYKRSDPFEGLMPTVMLEAFKDLHTRTREQLLSNIDHFEPYIFNPNGKVSEGNHLKAMSEFKALREKTMDIHKDFERNLFRIMKSCVVNCWHMNEYESEAMWRLYSENNKGIAIQTTAGELIDSLDDDRIFFSEIRYMDFEDKNITINDCLVGGQWGPLLKRYAFKHEQEARLYFAPKRDYVNISDDEYKFLHEDVDVDIDRLIKKVYISPYATEPFISSVKYICSQFGITPDKVIESTLLKENDSLNRLY